MDPLSTLVATFDVRRAVALVTLILIIGATAWSVDYYSDYSRFSRLERTLSMLERLDALDRRGAPTPELVEVRTKLGAELTKILRNPQAVSDGPPDGTDFSNWFRTKWPKFVAGAIPWFLISLTTIAAFKSSTGGKLFGFIGFQFLTLLFGFAATVIPPTEYKVVDYVLIPWGLLFAIGIIPMSIGMASAYSKVRDSSLQKAIMNNLRQLSAAADMYFLTNGVSEVKYSDLVGPGTEKFIHSLIVVDGEQYEELVIRQGEPIAVYRRSGEPVIFKP